MENLFINRIRELFEYHPDIGIFTRKVNVSPNAKAGDIAGGYSYGYLVIRIDGKLYRSHRLAWIHYYGKFPDGVIDHINGIKDDNRIINLRDVSNQVNQENRPKQKRIDINLPTGVRAMFRKDKTIYAFLWMKETYQNFYEHLLTKKRNHL